MDIATLQSRHPEHWRMACAIRALALDAVAAANSGHSGMPMGMADVATVLFARHLRFDAGAPQWPDRDRFILSAGHGSMLLYALLHLTGHADMTIDQIRAFRRISELDAAPSDEVAVRASSLVVRASLCEDGINAKCRIGLEAE